MANFSGIQNALASVRPASGRLGGLASAISKVADRLRQERETKQSLNLLGQTEEMKAKMAASPEYQTPKDKATANYYNSLADTIKGGGLSSLSIEDDSESSDIMSKFGISEEESEDYFLKPRMVRNRGVTSSVAFPERKKELSQKTVEDIASISSTVSDLMKNLETQESKKFNSGPGITTRSGAVGDITAQFFRGPEFTSWKSDVGRSFQKYRKWATGVAAGYPELQLLAPNFPKTTDTPEVFKQKTMSAVDDMDRNKKIFLDYLSKSNYATSQYRSIKKQPEQDIDTNKVGKYTFQ